MTDRRRMLGTHPGDTNVSGSTVLTNGRLDENGPAVDIATAGGRVVGIRPHTKGVAAAVPPSAERLDAAGGLILPGLHDHHIHLRAATAALASVEAGPPAVRDQAELARALDRPGSGWIRAVGYHDSVAGPLDRHALDRLAPDRPTRVQHRSGALWILNSAGLAALGGTLPDHAGVERDREGRPTGRLFRMDDWLAGRIQPAPLDLAEVGARAARAGVTGFTEAGPEPTSATVQWLADQRGSGHLPQRLMVMTPTGGSTLPQPGGAGGAVPGSEGAGLTWGPAKFLLDDDSLPGLEELARRFMRVHQQGRPLAVHCVTRAQLFLTLAALSEAGPAIGDRIEHGSVIPEEAVATIARLGLAVVTNPGFVLQRGEEYHSDVEPVDQPHLYRTRSLLDAGIPLAAGTDAPFGPADPWKAMRAAVQRRTAEGRPLGPGEAVGARAALGLFLGDPLDLRRPRHIEVGGPADLFVLGCPLPEAIAAGTGAAVTATVIAGRIVHRES
ncbi:MAG: amidohydrolase family protein [Acidimicrobiales bacterium]